MNIFKLTVLFIMILLSNFALLKVDFGKFFKKNSYVIACRKRFVML